MAYGLDRKSDALRHQAFIGLHVRAFTAVVYRDVWLKAKTVSILWLYVSYQDDIWQLLAQPSSWRTGKCTVRLHGRDLK